MSNISALRVTSGSPQVKLAHGWVPYGFLSLHAKQEVADLLNTAPSSARADFVNKVDMEWQVSNAVEPLRPPQPAPQGDPQGQGTPTQGTPAKGKTPAKGRAKGGSTLTEPQGGEPQPAPQGQQQGGGTPPPNMDEYVRHDVFDPWQSQTDDSIASLVGQISETTNRVGVVESTVAAMGDTFRTFTTDLDAVAVAVGEHEQRLTDLAAQVGKPTHFVITTAVATTVQPITGVQHHQFPKLARAVAAGQHCYLPGPAGSGKSFACEQVAESLGWEFSSISLGPNTPESRLWGGMDASGRFVEPPFVLMARHAMNNPESGAVFCLDEMDNGHAGVLATLNSAMANGWFTAPNGERVKWGRNFVIVAAANTFGTGPTAEFSGRNKLDAATLDRFAYLPWDTDVDMERTLVQGILHDDLDLCVAWLDVWHTARQNVAAHGLKAFVTMRGAQNGARLLRSGFTVREAFDMVLGSKVPADQYVKIDPF